MSALLPLALHASHQPLHVHPHHGSPGDYLAIALAAFISWAGVPGPGEAALIAAAVLAARHKLDIGTVEAVAFAGALVGGIVGWLVGRGVSEAFVLRPGPLHHWRERVLHHGHHFYERWGVLAVYFTPSWSAGVHRMRTLRFLPANAISAAIWTLVIGLATYLIGPSVADSVGDIGTFGTITLVVLVGGAIAVGRLRRRRRERDERDARDERDERDERDRAQTAKPSQRGQPPT